MVNQPKKRALLATALVSAMASAFAQEAANSQAQGGNETATAPSTVVVLGSRTQAKTALDTAVPVGLISAKDLQSAGSLELGKVLQDPALLQSLASAPNPDAGADAGGETPEGGETPAE